MIWCGLEQDSGRYLHAEPHTTLWWIRSRSRGLLTGAAFTYFTHPYAYLSPAEHIAISLRPERSGPARDTEPTPRRRRVAEQTVIVRVGCDITRRTTLSFDFAGSPSAITTASYTVSVIPPRIAVRRRCYISTPVAHPESLSLRSYRPLSRDDSDPDDVDR